MYKVKSIRIYSEKYSKNDLWKKKVDKDVNDLKAYRKRIISIASKRYSGPVNVTFEYSNKTIETNFELYKGYEIFESEQDINKIACRKIVENKYVTKHFKNVFEAKSYINKKD